MYASSQSLDTTIMVFDIEERPRLRKATFPFPLLFRQLAHWDTRTVGLGLKHVIGLPD